MITPNFSLNLLIAPIPASSAVLFRCMREFFSAAAAAIFYILSHFWIVPHSFVIPKCSLEPVFLLCLCAFFRRVHKNCTIRLLATIINLYSSTQFSELCEMHGGRKDIDTYSNTQAQRHSRAMYSTLYTRLPGGQLNWRDVKQRDERNIIYSVCECLCVHVYSGSRTILSNAEALAHPTQANVCSSNKQKFLAFGKLQLHSIFKFNSFAK